MIQNIMKIFIALFISLLNVNVLKAYTTIVPVWVTNKNFRAGSVVVINYNFNAPKINTFSLTYTSNLSGIPRVVFGFKCNKGN
jgi:hypothetical protein